LRYICILLLFNGRGNILINVHRRVVDNKYLFQIRLSALSKHYFFSHAQSTDDRQLSSDVKNKTVSVFIGTNIITSITSFFRTTASTTRLFYRIECFTFIFLRKTDKILFKVQIKFEFIKYWFWTLINTISTKYLIKMKTDWDVEMRLNIIIPIFILTRYYLQLILITNWK